MTQGAQIRSFVYTSLSRLQSTKHPETTGLTGHSFQYVYDNAGNLTQRTDARNIVTTWGNHDGLNRPTSITYSDGTPTVTYSYDTLSNGRGRLTAMTAGGTSQRITGYDKLGRVTASEQVTQGSAYSFTYTYDRAGNVRGITLPSGRSIAYGVDTAGRIASATGTKAGEAGRTYRSAVTFAPHGAPTSASMGNGQWESLGYNAKLQPTQVAVGGFQGASNLLNLTYGWTSPLGKNNGNVWSQTIAVPGFSHVQTYEYDGLNRLSSAREGSGAIWRRDFGHDGFGNMWVSVATGMPVSPGMPTQQSHIDAATNRLAGVAYDEAGNQLGIAPSVAAYDAENRMMTDRVQILSDVYERTYFYDGAGKRVRKVATANGVRAAESVYVYDAFGRVAAEYGTGTGGSGTEFLTADPLGSTRLVTSAGGGVVARRDYLPYGEEIPGGTGGRPAEFGAALGTTRKFTGKERDAETGLDYFGARYLSSVQGRWTSPDPVNISWDRLRSPVNTINKYAYAANNPLKYTDPDGQDITLFYRPATSLADFSDYGHVFLGAHDQSNNQVEFLDYYPAGALQLQGLEMVGPGAVNTGTLEERRGTYASLTIRTTPEVTQKVMQFMREFKANPAAYRFPTNTCVTACRAALEVAGIRVRSYSPTGLWNALSRRYSPFYRLMLGDGKTVMPPIASRAGFDSGSPRTDPASSQRLIFDLWLQQVERIKREDRKFRDEAISPNIP